MTTTYAPPPGDRPLRVGDLVVFRVTSVFHTEGIRRGVVVSITEPFEAFAARHAASGRTLRADLVEALRGQCLPIVRTELTATYPPLEFAVPWADIGEVLNLDARRN